MDKNANEREMIIFKPCDAKVDSSRLDEVLSAALLEHPARVIERVSEINDAFKNARVIFAIPLSDAGVNLEYYKLLEYFRENGDCLEGSVGGIIVDGRSELYTKALARRLAFSANMAGCTFPGKPLVEATGSLDNFLVLSRVSGFPTDEVYRKQVAILVNKVRDFSTDLLDAGSTLENGSEESKDIKILTIHAGDRRTSNSLLLWDKIKAELEARRDVESIREISLRNGDLLDCRGCSYEQCLHFGEQGGCFYGGIMTEQAFPAIIESDVLFMICPNYNDAVSANLTAFINRLTAIFRANDFSKKRIYALVVSGYSGGDLVAEQIIGAFNFNKEFILPHNFCMVETANDPNSILSVPWLDEKIKKFVERRAF